MDYSLWKFRGKWRGRGGLVECRLTFGRSLTGDGLAPTAAAGRTAFGGRAAAPDPFALLRRSGIDRR